MEKRRTQRKRFKKKRKAKRMSSNLKIFKTNLFLLKTRISVEFALMMTPKNLLSILATALAP
jgi:hypothetical protein